MKDITQELMHAVDLTVVAETKDELHWMTGTTSTKGLCKV